jgi:hypothetical protein
MREVSFCIYRLAPSGLESTDLYGPNNQEYPSEAQTNAYNSHATRCGAKTGYWRILWLSLLRPCQVVVGAEPIAQPLAKKG